jgi:hypothetical protein
MCEARRSIPLPRFSPTIGLLSMDREKLSKANTT